MKTLIIVIGALLTVGGAMVNISDGQAVERELTPNEKCNYEYNGHPYCAKVETEEQYEQFIRERERVSNTTYDYIIPQCEHGKGLEKATKGFKEGSTMYIYEDGCIKFK